MAIVALLRLRRRRPHGASSTCARATRAWDLRSYVAIHLSIILGVGVLVTGAIWARASWGHWWVWEEPMLVSFLVVFLLYCVYYPLRFSIEDRDRQARYSSVFAIAAGAFVPLNFVAVRLADSSPTRASSQTGGGLPGEMLLTFLVWLAAMALLFATLWKLELTAKHAGEQLGPAPAAWRARARGAASHPSRDARPAARRGRRTWPPPISSSCRSCSSTWASWGRRWRGSSELEASMELPEEDRR